MVPWEIQGFQGKIQGKISEDAPESTHRVTKWRKKQLERT